MDNVGCTLCHSPEHLNQNCPQQTCSACGGIGHHALYCNHESPAGQHPLSKIAQETQSPRGQGTAPETISDTSKILDTSSNRTSPTSRNASPMRHPSNSRSTYGSWSYNGRRKNRTAGSARTFTRSEVRK